MDQNYFTTDTLRKKGAHLTFEERVIIQTRLRDKQSYRSIAREITRIYYAHPYCSSDKGTNENHNGLFRRFLPKGKKIQDYPAEHISRVECWANTLP